MSKTKIGLIAGGVVVLLFIGVIVVVAMRLDGLVRSTVEREATQQLDLTTTLSGANVGLLGGTLTLDGLSIANPEGYSADHIFQLGQVNLDVSYRQLMNTPVRISRIDINSPTLTIERSGQTLQDLANINLRDLLDRLETDPEAETTKLIIGQLNVTNARIVIRPGIPELAQEYAVTIPDLQLNEIGTADESQTGAEIGRVTADLAVALAHQATQSDQLPPEVRAVLDGDLERIVNQYAAKLGERVQGQIQEQLGNLGDQLGGQLGDRIGSGDLEGAADEAAGEARDRLEEGLGGLLGGRRERQPTTQPK